MRHRLDPLLRPRSVAIIGASEREESVGRRTVHNLLAGGFEGHIYPVNPGRDSVLGLDCFPDLDSLPGPAEHVVFCVHDRHIESALDAAIEHGARAATIMSQLLIENDDRPALAQRVEAKVLESGLLVCGPNGMGFYNCQDGVWVCGFDTRENHVRGGHVTLISHSGSAMSGIVDVEERIDFNLAVSTGQELNVGMHDYMDFVLDNHDTRVIGLFMETVRQPEAFKAVLEKANQKGVPVVAVKVGRTELSKTLAVSHSGALAGEDSAYAALFDRYGVQRVDDLHEWVSAMMLFAQPHELAPGGLVTLHDSGGERQLLIDVADRMKTPLTRISDRTVEQLETLLDPGLPAVNPLDAWGAGGPDADRVMEDCLAALMRDPGTAMGAVVHARAPHSTIYPEYIDYLRAGHAASGKPACLVANHQGSGSDPLAIQATREGFPVIDGLRPFLAAVNCLFGWRDFQSRPAMTTKSIPLDPVRHLLKPGEMDEAAASELLRELGLPINPCRRVGSEAEAVEAAETFGYPVVLKSAVPGLQHKTEQDGVHLDLQSQEQVVTAWNDLSTRLGPLALLAPMVRQAGLEMVLGMVQDAQFGALVMMGFGGTRLEATRDVVFAIPPFDQATARRLVESLHGHALFEHDRGAGRPDMAAYCATAAHFSSVVASLADTDTFTVTEIDINPLIVHSDGCTAVDALVISADVNDKHTASRKAS